MPACHAGVVSRNIQKSNAASAANRVGHLVPHNTENLPPYAFVPRSASGRALLKGALARGHVKRSKCKGKNGKKGKESLDLIVNIDLDEWQLTNEQVAEFKEVFMLFDKDEDGVITFPELILVMKSLGQRPLDEELLAMVRDVSEDSIYDTIEFNEFLQMMSKQQRKGLTEDSLKDAFRIFDKDDDGLISVVELRSIMKNLGEKMTDAELDEMIDAADMHQDGLVNYEEFVLILSLDGKKGKSKKTGKKGRKHRSKGGKEKASAVTASVKEAGDPKGGNKVPLKPNGNQAYKHDSGTTTNGNKSASSSTSENALNNNHHHGESSAAAVKQERRSKPRIAEHLATSASSAASTAAAVAEVKMKTTTQQPPLKTTPKAKQK